MVIFKISYLSEYFLCIGYSYLDLNIGFFEFKNHLQSIGSLNIHGASEKVKLCMFYVMGVYNQSSVSRQNSQGLSSWYICRNLH
mgnify:CR=1 FL=1